MSKELSTKLAVLAAIGAARFPSLSFRNEANPESELKEVNASLEKVSGELKTYAEKSEKELKAHGKLAEETKLEVDKLLLEKTELNNKQAEILNRLGDIELKVQTPVNSQRQVLSLGEQFVNDDSFKAQFGEGEVSGKVNMSQKLKKPLNAITSDPASGGALVDPMRLGVVVGPERALRIRDLLNWGQTTQTGSIEFPREKTFTNNADTVAEGNAKPESVLDYELDTAKIATIAHYIKASKQVLADAPMLQALIDQRLSYGVLEKEEDQLMKGDGLGANMEGIFTQASAYVQPTGVNVVNETFIDRLRLAMLQVELADYMADAITINPTDWANIELTKDSQFQYIFTNPQGMTAPMLWGKPVVPTKSLAFSEFMVGDFARAAQAWKREDVTVTVSNSDQDDFIKNLITILAEERAAVTVYQAAAFVKGDFDGLYGT